MSARWDRCGPDEVKVLLAKAESLAMEGPEASAYDYLIEATWDGLWDQHRSHEALRLWSMCCELVERAVAAAGQEAVNTKV